MKKTGHTGRVKDSEKRLLSIDMPGSWGQLHHHNSFSRSDLRRTMEPIFDIDASYTIFRTVANEKALKEFEKYVAVRDGVSDPWYVRLRKKDDKPEYYPDMFDNCKCLKFSPALMDTYGYALAKLAKEHIGEKNYASLPLVRTEGVHSTERHRESIFWYVRHIVKDVDDKPGFREISDLCTEEAYEIIRARESPQFYQMREIDVLYKAGIQPLVVDKKEVHITGAALKDYFDCFDQFTHSRESMNQYAFDDD